MSLNISLMMSILEHINKSSSHPSLGVGGVKKCVHYRDQPHDALRAMLFTVRYESLRPLESAFIKKKITIQCKAVYKI